MSQATCEHDAMPTARDFGAWIDMATLLGLAAFLLFSFFSGRVKAFLVWPYVLLPPAASLILLAMFAARAIGMRRGRAACGCGHNPAGRVWGQTVCAAILLLPIALALWVNPTSLSAEGARKRRPAPGPRDLELKLAIDWVFARHTAKKATDGPVTLPPNPTVLDLLTAATENHPKNLESQFVSVIGRCDLPAGPPGERFSIFRLVVTCCVADATAVALEVAHEPKAKLRSGDWVEVRGLLRFDNTFDPSLPVVHATTVTPIAEPREPYL